VGKLHHSTCFPESSAYIIIGRNGRIILEKRQRLWLYLCILIIGFVILRNAWVCDDAYISFRTVDNLINGYGLTWNTDERVQGFTNPLWVFLISAFYAIIGDVYFTSIFVSLVLVLFAVFLFSFKVARSPTGALLGIAILLFSKAFIDFSTSGLENPLTFLIIAVFLTVYFTRVNDLKTLFYLSLMASLGTLNRMDTILLYLPALVYLYLNVKGRRKFLIGLAGFAPFILWEAFAMVYYGFPFPNTYYAKLHAGIPVIELFQQGLAYFLETLHRDPLTLIVIFSSLVVVVVSKSRRGLPVALGILLYLLYTIRVGGDFMSGRFFAAPLFCAVILISRYRFELSGITVWAPFAVVVLIGLTSPKPPLLNDIKYGVSGKAGINDRGIADERGWYYQSTGLLRASRYNQGELHNWMRRGRVVRLSNIKVKTTSSVGFEGFAVGPKVHIVDAYALTDPLLSRVPTFRRRDWRIGHFSRVVPRGYVRTVSSGKNLLDDAGLAAYYDKLSLIIRGRVFSIDRFVAIWKMNTGAYDHLLESYCNSPMIYAEYAEICNPRSTGTEWDDEGNVVIRPGGISVQLNSVVHNKQIEISVDHNDYFYFVYLRDKAELGWQKIDKKPIPTGGLRVDTLDVPEDVRVIGYDCLEVYPWSGDDLYSMGHVRMIDESE
jgi:arabinofuranosyltransferase